MIFSTFFSIFLIPVRQTLVGSFYFDWHILTGHCTEFFEELNSQKYCSNEFLNVRKWNDHDFQNAPIGAAVNSYDNKK